MITHGCLNNKSLIKVTQYVIYYNTDCSNYIKCSFGIIIITIWGKKQIKRDNMQ